MAVLDFDRGEARKEKAGSDLSEGVVRLTPTPKAARLVKTLAPKTYFIGFKLEVGKGRDELLEIGRAWAGKNGADLGVANDLREIETGTHIGDLVGTHSGVGSVAAGA